MEKSQYLILYKRPGIYDCVFANLAVSQKYYRCSHIDLNSNQVFKINFFKLLINVTDNIFEFTCLVDRLPDEVLSIAVLPKFELANSCNFQTLE